MKKRKTKNWKNNLKTLRKRFLNLKIWMEKFIKNSKTHNIRSKIFKLSIVSKLEIWRTKDNKKKLKPKIILPLRMRYPISKGKSKTLRERWKRTKRTKFSSSKRSTSSIQKKSNLSCLESKSKTLQSKTYKPKCKKEMKRLITSLYNWKFWGKSSTIKRNGGRMLQRSLTRNALSLIRLLKRTYLRGIL